MNQYIISPVLTIQVQPDGSLVASSVDLPVFIVARDLPTLRRKLRAVSDSVARYLDGLGEHEASLFLEERGVEAKRVDADGTVSFPVLVGASA